MLPTRKDIRVEVSFEDDDYGRSAERVSFVIEEDGQKFDLYYYENHQWKDDEEGNDKWYEYCHEELIPSTFSGATETDYEFRGNFDEVASHLWDYGFRNIVLYGLKYRS